MRILALAGTAAVGAMAVLSACSSSSTSTGAANTATVSFAAPQYIQRAAVADEFEIQSGRLALERSQNPTVRSFGEQMIRDHTASSNHLQAAVAAKGGSVPGLDSEHAQMLEQLRALRGPAFDAAYMRMQLQAHQEALAAQNTYGQAGDDPQLRQLAVQALPMVEHHLIEARTVAQNVAAVPATTNYAPGAPAPMR